jgi:hypothetical protein
MQRCVVWMLVCLVAAGSGYSVQRPAVGKKMDNFLNHNLPFAQLEYSCSFDMEEPRSGPYGSYTETWQEECSEYVEFEFYDEMDAKEKVQADSNNQFQNLFSSVGSWVASTVIGMVANKAGGAVAPGLASSTSGQVVSGVFGSAINDATGWGAAAGNW